MVCTGAIAGFLARCGSAFPCSRVVSCIISLGQLQEDRWCFMLDSTLSVDLETRKVCFARTKDKAPPASQELSYIKAANVTSSQLLFLLLEKSSVC